MKMYERPSELKVDLSKAIKMMDLKDDILIKNPKLFWREKLFKNDYLKNLNLNEMEKMYRIAKGENVVATFERIRKEIQDLHYQNMFQKEKLPLAPVQSYFDGRSKQNKESSITFATRKGERYVDVTLTLERRFRAPIDMTQHRISVEIHANIENSITELFSKFLMSGELLINFITNTLWPELEKSLGRCAQNAVTSGKRQSKSRKKRDRH